jgi:Na+:H+ antiporter
MTPSLILGLIGGLLVLAFIANRVFRLTRIPDVVLLMALGVVVGPVLHLVNPERLSRATSLLGTLALILVLFEGGLELDIRKTLQHFRGSLLLAVLAYAFSTGLVALIVCKGLGLSLTAGLLVGAVLGCTSSTVVLPILQQLAAEAEEPVRIMLMLEASWGDVLAVLTVGLLIGIRSHGGPIATGLMHGVLVQLGVAILFSVVAGILWSRLLPVLSEQRFWQVLTFSIVLMLYAGTESLGANGLIAVLGFGMTLANFPGLDPDLLGGLGTASHQALLTFHSELAFLVRTFFFVLIGAIAELQTFRQHPLLMAGTIGALFFARWLAVQASRWTWSGISAKGREVITWMFPRGLITVVLAIEAIDSGGKQLSFLSGLAFAVILATNLLVVLGTVWSHHGESGPLPATSSEATLPATESGYVPGERLQPPPVAATRSPTRRWLFDAALLFLLGLGGLLLWYGNQPLDKRPASLRHWIEIHSRHSQ